MDPLLCYREPTEKARLALWSQLGGAGRAETSSAVCNVLTSNGWVRKSTAFSNRDWGYATDRAWAQLRNGTVSYSATVGAGNQIRCCTFTGTALYSRTSPPPTPATPTRPRRQGQTRGTPVLTAVKKTTAV